MDEEGRGEGGRRKILLESRQVAPGTCSRTFLAAFRRSGETNEGKMKEDESGRLRASEKSRDRERNRTRRWWLRQQDRGRRRKGGEGGGPTPSLIVFRTLHVSSCPASSSSSSSSLSPAKRRQRTRRKSTVRSLAVRTASYCLLNAANVLKSDGRGWPPCQHALKFAGRAANLKGAQ